MSEFRIDEFDHGAIADSSVGLAALIRRLANELDDKDLVRLGTELGDFARDDPGAMFAGSVALGFGLARLRDKGVVRLDGESLLRAVESFGGAPRVVDAEERLDLSANAGGETPPKRTDGAPEPS